MNVTNKGLALIKEFEGFRAQAYCDAVGIMTIGYGHTSMAGAPRVEAKMKISKTDAEAILRRDVEMFAEGVRKCLTRSVNDDQFSAIVSFAFNVGLANFSKSSVLRAINRGEFDDVPNRLNLWVKAGGRTLAGLIRRRQAEGRLFAEASTAYVPRQPDPPKSIAQSKTIYAAFVLLIVSLLQQLWFATSIVLQIVGGLVIVSAVLFIIFERIQKIRKEGM